MPRTIDLFIDHPDEAQLLAHVGTAVHQRPAPVADGRWDVRVADGIGAHLERRPDTPDLPLPAYRHDLWVRSDHAVPAHEDPAAAALRVVADALRHSGCRVLLVHDLQHLHRRAEDRAGAVAAPPPSDLPSDPPVSAPVPVAGPPVTGLPVTG